MKLKLERSSSASLSQAKQACLICLVVYEEDSTDLTANVEQILATSRARDIVVVTPSTVSAPPLRTEFKVVTLEFSSLDAVPVVAARAALSLGYETFAFLRVGVVLPTDWDRHLLQYAEKFDHIGLVSPRSNRLSFLAVDPALRELGVEEINAKLSLSDRGSCRDVPLFLDTCGLARGVTESLAVAAGSDEEVVLGLRGQGASLIACDSVFVEDQGARTCELPVASRRFNPLLLPPTGQEERRGARLHVLHSWGGGVQRWVDDFIAVDPRPSLVLKSRGTRDAFGEQLDLYRSDLPAAPILSWKLDFPIGATAIAHAQYRQIVRSIVLGFEIESIVVSSLIGHALDVLVLGKPTIVVTHDYYPYCLGIVMRFGEICQECDSTRLGFCAMANDLHPFREMTDSGEWMELRSRLLACLRAAHITAVAPDSSVREHLCSLDSRFDSLNWRVIPHGTSLAKSEFSHWATQDSESAAALKRPLRVLVLGRLNTHKGLNMLRELAERAPGDFQLLLVGCGRYGLEMARLPTVECVIPDYSLAELPKIVGNLRPDCGLLLSIWHETFSYTLTELQAFCIPPVATTLGAFASRIEHGRDGFLSAADSASVASLLRDLRADPARLIAVATSLTSRPIRSLDQMLSDYERISPTVLSSQNDFLTPATCLLQGLVGNNDLAAQFEAQRHGLVEISRLKDEIGRRDLSLAEEERRVLQLRAQLAAQTVETKEVTNRLHDAQRERKAVQGELAWVYSSRSWRTTGLLRRWAGMLRQSRNVFRGYAGIVLRAAKDPRRALARLATISRERLRSSLYRPGATPALSAGAKQNPLGWLSVGVVGNEFRGLADDLSVDSRIRAIAFYLPQFHPIPENDAWWGRGFTEWTNVTRAVPQFEGHYQPHLPGELGFYDLRLPEVQRRQMELAKNYGLYGFCYHYYWFSGKKLLDRPLTQHLADPTMEFPFCVSWANENWTRRWDGREDDVLMAQHYRDEDANDFIQDLLPVLQDPRYITIDGRPLILVYRVDMIPNVLEVVREWRQICHENQMPDPYLVAVQSFKISDPRPYGFDAAVEFPPHQTLPSAPPGGVSLLNPDYQGQVHDYLSIIPDTIHWPDYRLFKCVMPSWDNEARKPGKGISFVRATPAAYRTWLGKVVAATDAHHGKREEKLVFINAWNEWAEGAHLEPDRRFGYAYLHATAEVLMHYPLAQLSLIESTQRKITTCAHTAVILNLYYEDLWEEIYSYISNIPSFDLYISVRCDISPSVLARILEQCPQAQLFAFANRGRDIGPFFEIMSRIKTEQYKYVCKIHSKRSKHRMDGDEWRVDLLRKLLGSPAKVHRILQAFDRWSDIGLIGPEGHLVPGTTFWGSNEKRVKDLARQMGVGALPDEFSFFAGSMFWFRPAALSPLFDLKLSSESFELEAGQLDGTLAHAIERVFPLAVAKSGFRQLDTLLCEDVVEAGSVHYEFCEPG